MFIYLFILAELGLPCCAWAFSSCGQQELFPSCGAQASLFYREYGLSGCGKQA